jgi:GMP synthase (glutamine-hydrolysing)
VNVVVIDNGGQWTHLEYRALKELGTDVKILPNSTRAEEIECDALVLSGGKGSVNDGMGFCDEYLDKLGVPVLGICMGLHIIARHFGGQVEKGAGEYGKIEISVTDRDEIFANLPKNFNVWESHGEEVTFLPDCFSLLASSETCKVEAVKLKDVYGVQFHPEVRETENGKAIMRNFLELTR